MDKLNGYLKTLLTTSSYELHLEPNRPPFVISSSGINELQNTAILGTQISQIVFPLIPANVRKELPDKPEVEFVHPHNLGSFSFTVKKSPAGFMVTIRPLNIAPSEAEQMAIEASLKEAQPALPTTSSYHTVTDQDVVLPEPEPPVLSFENLKLEPQIEPEMASQTPNLKIEESKAVIKPFESLPQIETSPINDPEFITTFSDSSTYEPPGKQSDYFSEVKVISQADYSQGYEPPQFVAAPQYSPVYPESEAFQIPQPQVLPEVIPPFQAVQPPQFYQETEAVSQPQSRLQSEIVPTFQPIRESQFTEQFHPPYAEPLSPPIFVAATANPEAKSKMNELFHKMAERKSSDLHLSVSMPPLIRVDGRIQPLEENQAALEAGEMRELLTSIMPDKNQEEFETRRDTDFAYEIEGLARFRANIFMDRKGMGGVFRIIPSKILTSEDLGLSKYILDLCDLSKGLVLVTGPTGSGKSTTLCAMIDYINRNREDHLITIEDPIEFVHENKQCLVNQREVHNHTDSFKDALRAALREDPDIVLVGEMRDLETIAIAIETAETGHLVFGTLHTTTAVSTVDRIIDQFPADRQQQIRVMLSESLKGVIAQTLLPKKGGGRIAALEILIVTPAVSNLIREGKTFQIASSMQTGKNIGMVMLNDALFDLVQKGLVEPRDAYIKAVDKTNFESMLTRNGFKMSA